MSRPFIIIIVSFFFLNSPDVCAQSGRNVGLIPRLDINVKRTGPYLGLQQGKYTLPEFGVERQWKKIRLKNPIVHAAHMGFNYNFRHAVLGYDLGYWVRPHRFGLTYGGNLFFRSDFTHNKVGIAPVIGYKIWFVHIQTGYHVMANPNQFETNTLFVSIRIGIINDRDISIEWKK